MTKVLPKKKAGSTIPPQLPLRGTVHQEWKKCGKAGCRCSRGAPGQLHGPYYYRFERVNRRLRKHYVPRPEVDQVRAACKQRQEAARRDRENWREAREDIVCFREVMCGTREKLREYDQQHRERSRLLRQVSLWEPGTFARWEKEGLPSL